MYNSGNVKSAYTKAYVSDGFTAMCMRLLVSARNIGLEPILAEENKPKE